MLGSWFQRVGRVGVLAGVLVMGLCSTAVSQQVIGRPDETPAQRDARMKWWREARFGMFIHWGVYSVPGGIYKGQEIPSIGEWIMHNAKIPVAEYKAFAKQFNPVRYDPDAWVRLAKEAGMKYIVITSKHHDGFALFDSKVTDWDVVDATPYGKDLLKPLAEACAKHGLVLGFYYSQAQDWNHPGGAAAGGHWDPAQDGSMDDYIRNIAAPQVKEILSNYGKLGVLWWDTPVDMTKERADLLMPLLALQPQIITNDRLGGGYAGDTRHARAAHPRHRHPRPRLGNLHDHERHLGLQERRPQLEVHRDPDPQPLSTSPARAATTCSTSARPRWARSPSRASSGSKRSASG